MCLYNHVRKIFVKFDKQFFAYLTNLRREKELSKTVISLRALLWFIDLSTPTTFTDDDICISNLLRISLCQLSWSLISCYSLFADNQHIVFVHSEKITHVGFFYCAL